MDQSQSTIMPDDSISQNPDDDILSIVEIVEDGSTVASQASNSSQGLPAAPSTCLKAPPPRFLVVSEIDPESLKTAKSHVEQVAPAFIEADRAEQVFHVSVQL